MNIVISENTSLNKYSAEITCDENITSYFQSENFTLIIRDLITNEQKIILADEINNYNIKNSSLTDYDDIIMNSLIINEGLIIYTDNNKIYFHMLTNCSNGVKSIGYNSSEISIYFNGINSDVDISFYTKLLPNFYIDKDKPIILNKPESGDPSLEPNAIRPDYDYTTIKTYATTDRISLNNFINNNYNNSIPYENYCYVSAESKDSDVVYVSKLSAFFANESNINKIKLADDSTAISILYDETTDTSIDIPFEISEQKSLNLNVYNDYNTTLYYKEVTQFLVNPLKDLRKNVLQFKLGTEVL